jgi:hypothetical protein
MLDQGLGDRRIHVVVGHLVAHPVGRPAESDLAEIPGSQHHRIVVVGEPEEMGRPLPRLNVLEGDVVQRFALRERVPDVFQQLSISSAVIPSSAMSAWAFDRVVLLVANPGMV